EKPTAQGEGFHGFRLDDASQELTSALVTDRFWIELQRPVQQPLLEEASGIDGQPPLQPGGEQAARDHGEQEQGPGQESGHIEAPLEGPPTNHPPGEEPQEILHGVHADEGEETLRQARTARLAPETRAAWQTQTPAASDPRGAKLLAQDGRPRPLPTP